MRGQKAVFDRPKAIEAVLPGASRAEEASAEVVFDKASCAALTTSSFSSSLYVISLPSDQSLIASYFDDAQTYMNLYTRVISHVPVFV